MVACKAPDAFLHPQFWAEDGAVFFAQQHAHSWPLLFVPYAGYLHVIPRLVAWSATALPVVAAPTVYSAAALVLGAGGIAALRILGHLAVPFWLVLATVLLTPTNDEVFGSLTNAQWLTQFVLLGTTLRWLLGEAPGAGWRRRITRTALLVTVGLSGPFCIFATFAAVAGRLSLRPPMSRAGAAEMDPGVAERSTGAWEIAVIAACALVQSLFVMRTAGLAGSSWGTRAMVDVAQALPAHLFDPALFPALPLWSLLAVLATASMVTMARRQKSALVALLAYVGITGFAVAAKFGGDASMLHSLRIGDRYFIVPKLVAWWLLASALAGLLPQWKRLGRLLVLALLLGSAAYQPAALRRRSLPQLGWGQYAKAIQRGEHVIVRIHPKPWTFEVGPSSGHE